MDNINVLTRVLFEKAKKECESNNCTINIQCTTRTKQEQLMLYCHGRTKEQAKKAGIPQYIINLSYKNPKTSTYPKKVYSLYSMHFEGRAIDIKTNNIDKSTDIFEKYGFIVKKRSNDMLHVEIDSNFQNKFNKQLCTPSIINLLKKCLNKKLNSNLVLNGSWDLEFQNALFKYKENSSIAKKNDPSVNVNELNELLTFI